VVRDNVGFDRFEGEEATRDLNAFYRVLRLRVNYLQPCLMIESKERVGSKIRKRYGLAKTPCQRALEHPALSEECKQVLREQLAGLTPMEIAKEILRLREELRRHAR